MTIDQIIALGASIGACLAAIATFLTVQQMKMQRELSYHPELVLSRVIFESLNSNGGNSLPNNWIKRNSDGDIIEPKGLNWFGIPLCNVGLGAAKELIVSWSFPISELVEEINELAQRTMTPAYFTFHNDTLSINSDILPHAAVFWKNDQSERIDYVLPASIDKEPVMLKLPISYIYLISALIFLSCKDNENKQKFFPKFPLLKVILEYFDIGKVKHQTTFEIHFNLVACGGNGEIFQAYLQPQKCTGTKNRDKK